MKMIKNIEVKHVLWVFAGHTNPDQVFMTKYVILFIGCEPEIFTISNIAFLFGSSILDNFIIVSPSSNRWDGHYSQNLNIEKM